MPFVWVMLKLHVIRGSLSLFVVLMGQLFNLFLLSHAINTGFMTNKCFKVSSAAISTVLNKSYLNYSSLVRCSHITLTKEKRSIFEFFLFLKFSTENIVKSQWDLNFDFQSRWEPRWPLNHTSVELEGCPILTWYLSIVSLLCLYQKGEY